MAFKRTKRIFKKRLTKKSSRRPARKAMPIKKMIRREIARTAENKQKNQFVADYALYSATHANFPLNVIPLGPNAGTMAITQGTGQGNRIGNRITTKKLVFRGVLTPQDWDTTTNPNPRPVQVKLLILYDREDENAVPVPGSNFFQDGSSTTGFTGTQMDLIKSYNLDRYRILTTRSFKLGMSQYAGTATTAANQANWQAYSNNDFKFNCNFKVDLTKYYPKVVKFNDNLSDPTSRGLFALWYYVAADGTTLASTSTCVNVSYAQEYTYEDA